MEDRVYYAPLLGFAGTVANVLFVAPALRRIFWYRVRCCGYALLMFATGAALEVGIEVNPPDSAGLSQCSAVKLRCRHDNENAQPHLG
jgi:hypothetical protein